MYVRTNLFISNKEKSHFEEVDFYLKKSRAIVLKNRIDDTKEVEMSIIPQKLNNLYKLRITIEIIDDLNKDDIIIKTYTEDIKTFLKIYKLKFKDIIYYIDLDCLKEDDVFLTNLNTIAYYKSAQLQLEKNINYLDELIKCKNLNTDIELMLLACLVLINYDRLDDVLLTNIKEKLSYYGHNEEEIREDLDDNTDEAYKINCLNYLLRKLYNLYDDVDKNSYLEDRKDWFDDELGDDYFIKYVREYYNKYKHKLL